MKERISFVDYISCPPKSIGPNKHVEKMDENKNETAIYFQFNLLPLCT